MDIRRFGYDPYNSVDAWRVWSYVTHVSYQGPDFGEFME